MTCEPYTVTIRFYEELNDFLPRQMKKKDMVVKNTDRRSVKDLMESLGVPHVEVDLILVNGESVDFTYIIREGDRISVYPEFERLDISSVTRLRPEGLREPRFVLDVHLRKLARRLRMLGFDVDYEKHRDDPELAEISQQEKRILLTRDRQLLMRRNVDRGFMVRNTDPEKQVVEVLARLDLWEKIEPFRRCTECNGMVKPLPVGSERFEKEKNRIPAGVLSWCDEYYICDLCGRIYWKGSHYDKMKTMIEKILQAAPPGMHND